MMVFISNADTVVDKEKSYHLTSICPHFIRIKLEYKTTITIEEATRRDISPCYQCANEQYNKYFNQE